MKKVILFLAAVSIAAAANARILRVSNVSGSSAPFSTVADAQAAATAGDTIMVDFSATSYGDVELTKKLVLLGPGYWLVENKIISEGASDATFNNITTYAEGTTIKGINCHEIIIHGSKTIVNRCHVPNITIKDGVSNCIIHQNSIYNVIGNSYGNSTYHQITNNIIRQVTLGMWIIVI